MDEQLTAQQEQEYVEARWKEVLTYPATKQLRIYDGIKIFQGFRLTNPKGSWSKLWHAAFLFTKERERQIAEVEEEVALLEAEATLWPNFYKQQAAYSRILAREQAALAELKRGMK